MLRGTFDAAETTPSGLRSAYDDRLRETVDRVGLDTAAADTDIDRERLAALAGGDSPALTLSESAAILGLDETLPDRDVIVAEARDILLIGMSTAVLDVEAIAAGIEDQLDPKEIQQKVEGRHPIPLDEYALLHSYIEGEKP